MTPAAGGAAGPLRIAYLTSRFPVLSDTPFLNQITGLVARGHAVDVFSDQPQEDVPFHPDVERFGLLARTTYTVQLPRGSRAERMAEVRRRLRDAAPGDRAVLLRALNPLVFWKRAWQLDMFRRAATFLPRRAYDICQCAFGYDGVKAVRLRRTGAVGGRLVVSFRGADTTSYVSRRSNRVYAGVFRDASLLMPVSEALAERLVELGAPPERIQVHRTGIDLSRYPFRARSPEPGRPVRLVTVARLVEKKGIAYALEAIAAAVRGGADLAYDVLGDGPLRGELTALAERLGIAERVTFHGWVAQDETRAMLDRSHILLAPSVTARNGDQEGVPNVLKEAMAAGLPVIGTRHGGIPELVEDGVSGHLVPERDAAALHAAITALLARPERWAALGAAGRERVLRDYDIDRLNDRLVATYERLLAAPERR